MSGKKRPRNPLDTPCVDPDVIRTTAASGVVFEPGRDTATVAELAERLGIKRSAAKAEIQRTIQTLTIDDFAGNFDNGFYPPSDEYGVYINGVGIYIKLRLDHGKVNVISFHPMHDEPLRTRANTILKSKP